MMQRLEADLPALISSRICHDLANPLMAIANGMELLELSGLTDTPEAALLADSVDAARARMESFRLAFGFAGPEDRVAGRKSGEILARSLRERNIRLDWQLEGEMPRRRARIACLLALCAETALPRGGEIRVWEAGGALHIHASGPAVRDLGDLWETLCGNDGALPRAAEVHFVLARMALEQSGLTAQLVADAGAVEIVARPTDQPASNGSEGPKVARR